MNAEYPGTTGKARGADSRGHRRQEKLAQRKQISGRLQHAFWQRKAREPQFDQHELAETIGVTPQAVSQWLSGVTSPSAHHLARLADLLGVELSWLQGWSEESLAAGAKARVMPGYARPPQGRSSGCRDNRLINSSQLVDYLAFQEEWLRLELGVNPSNLALVVAQGDGMAPTIQAGDIVLVDKSVREVRIDSLYVFCIDDNLGIKRAQALFNGNILIKSDNRNYCDEQVISPESAGSLQVFGRILLVTRRI